MFLLDSATHLPKCLRNMNVRTCLVDSRLLWTGRAGAPVLPAANTQAKAELADLIASLQDTQPVGPLVARCRTLDQARAVVTFLDATSEKTLRSTVALTATRGRGKVCSSASLLDSGHVVL
jgi:tRNA(Met) C34 N-acetyltransferase TmcA